MTACFGGGFQVLMVRDLNAKHVDWNTWLVTKRGELLREYADGNSCLIFGIDTPTTNPYKPSATLNVLKIVVTKGLSFPVYITSCSVLSSDHLQVQIDTACRSSFHHSPDRPNFRHTWKIKFRSIWNCTMGCQSTHALRTSPGQSCRLWRHLFPSTLE
jgi:hypothetical protein